MENLYDTVDDPRRLDDEFTPGGTHVWTGERYRQKIQHLAAVIRKIGTEAAGGLAVFGLCEVENKTVLQDLVNAADLKDCGYKYVLLEGPDARGIDPALIYDPRYFQPGHISACRVRMVTDTAHATRDILVVNGRLADEPVCILINHWPSRRGGELASRPNRNAAAALARRIADSVMATGIARVIIMGDFNDDPVNASIKKHLRTQDQITNNGNDAYFNPMEALYRRGIGTLAWQDSWNLFDQVILSPRWVRGPGDSLSFHVARVFNPPFLRADFGNFRGYPFRTYSGGAYTGGYSDHFPVYVILKRRRKA